MSLRVLPPPGSPVPRVTVVLAVLVVPFILLGGLAAMYPGGVSAVAEALDDTDPRGPLPDSPRFPPLAERSVIVAADGRTLATVHGLYNRRVVPLDVVPDHAWQAVVAAEDRRFFDHDGYDVRAMSRAARANLVAGRIVQGGSTITQQLAKTFVGDDVTVQRKIDELRVALALEERYTKEQVLERYLNEVYFGAGAYGIAAAAEEFFGVAPEDLAVDQAALLAGLIRAPSRLNPRVNPDGARQRRDAVLDAMVAEGFLQPRDAAALRGAPVEVRPPPERRPRDPHVVAAVRRAFLSDPAFGDTRAERADLLLTGGLRITTTIDVDLQRWATQLIHSTFPGQEGPTAAIAAVDPVSGAVRVAATGRDFGREQSNAALQGRRQPGSAFKTFVLVAALEEGYPLSTTLTGRSGVRFGTPSRTGDWATRGVRNFGHRSYGRVTAREALVRSINTAFADLVLRVGAEHVLDVTDRLGISREAYGGLENAGIALGGLDRGVSPLEMASAYGTFANSGIATRPYVIASVTDRHGEEIHRADPHARQAIEPALNAVVLDVLREAVERGTGTAARLPGWPVAGKTGTTQDNEDVWFVGTTPVLSAAVWIGNPERRERLVGMSSSGTAAPLWREFMLRALRGAEPVAFPAAASADPTRAVGRAPSRTAVPTR